MRILTALTACILSLGVGGCTTHRAADTESTVHFARDAAVPTRPPKVVLSGKRRTTGRLYIADWTVGAERTIARPVEPVVWPDARSTLPADSIEFTSAALPDEVRVSSYEVLDPSSHVPSGNGVTLDCFRAAEPRCAMTVQSGVARLRAASSVLAGPYVVVFARWHLAGSQNTSLLASPFVSAAWLFHVGSGQEARP